MPEDSEDILKDLAERILTLEIYSTQYSVEDLVEVSVETSPTLQVHLQEQKRVVEQMLYCVCKLVLKKQYMGLKRNSQSML